MENLNLDLLVFLTYANGERPFRPRSYPSAHNTLVLPSSSGGGLGVRVLIATLIPAR